MNEVSRTTVTDTERYDRKLLDWMQGELEKQFPGCDAVVEYRGDALYFGLFPWEVPA